MDGPMMLLCDASSALRVAAGEGSAARLKFELQRTAQVTHRLRNGNVSLAHVPDAGQYMDFMTKFLKDGDKVEQSIAFLCGFHARAAHDPQWRAPRGTAASTAAALSAATLWGDLVDFGAPMY